MDWHNCNDCGRWLSGFLSEDGVAWCQSCSERHARYEAASLKQREEEDRDDDAGRAYLMLY